LIRYSLCVESKVMIFFFQRRVRRTPRSSHSKLRLGRRPKHIPSTKILVRAHISKTQCAYDETLSMMGSFFGYNSATFFLLKKTRAVYSKSRDPNHMIASCIPYVVEKIPLARGTKTYIFLYRCLIMISILPCFEATPCVAVERLGFMV